MLMTIQALANDATTFDLMRLHDCPDAARAPTVPIICIPTTFSGGEYSARAGAANDTDKRKYPFTGPIRGPSLVILDPELTTTTPDRWWLSTGIRAVDHCVEGLCAMRRSPESDETAARGLNLLMPGLLRCKADPNDLDARLSCQKGVIAAMEAITRYHVEMGASHGIGHQLGPLGVGHGETSCILLPAVCLYNVKANSERQALVSRILWSAPAVADALRSRNVADDTELGDMLDILFRILEMPRTFKDVGIDIGDTEFLDRLAQNSMHDRHMPTNPIPIRVTAQVLQILNMCK